MRTSENTFAVGLMAKAPLLGKVKTRLAADIGDESALALYRELLLRIHDEFCPTPATEESRITYHWFIEPDEQISNCRKFLPNFTSYHPQSSGDLGARMQSAFERLLQNNARAILIGADIPDISSQQLEAAADALDKSDIVLGPTHDGGYYLIGLKRVHPELFTNITWSSADTLSETLRSCAKNHINYHLLEPLADLDTVEDFAHIRWRPKDPALRSLFDSSQ